MLQGKPIRNGSLIAAIAAVLLASAAQAADTKPTIDVAKPHNQIYPVNSQRAGEEGTIALKLYVLTNGTVGKVLLLKSSGFDNLDNAALESAMNWHYIPATKNGDTVSDWATVQLVYKLPEAQSQAANGN